MNQPSQNGGNAPSQEKPLVEYDAVAASPHVTGDVKLTIGETGLSIVALFDAVEVPFADMNALDFTDYVVSIAADGAKYVFSRMGSWAQPFYDALWDAYNKAVLRALFVKGSPVLTSTGAYSYTEDGVIYSGSAPVQVYDDGVVLLPPDLGARRIPLCFLAGVEKKDHSITLRLDTEETYTLSKLGYDTVPFIDALEAQIRALRERALESVKELDPTLAPAQASQFARLIPEGASATFDSLAAIAPSFVEALEGKITETRSGPYYSVLRESCDPGRCYVGFHKKEAGASGKGLPGLSGEAMSTAASLLGATSDSSGGGQNDAEHGSHSTPDQYLFWLVFPSPDGEHAVVEFTEADSATFVYRTGGDFDAFARRLGRALEAIDFKREVIRLTDEELKKSENADYLMAAKRTAALQFVRRNFAGRVIHSSVESWKTKLAAIWGGKPPAQAEVCFACGAALTPGVKFCGTCGVRLLPKQ